MEGTIGEIRLFGGNFAPKGWHICDGTKFNVKGNEALFSIIGINFGGDGRTYFQLPKIEPFATSTGGRLTYIICIDGFFPKRA